MPARYSSPRFVGRERELAAVASALERAAAGRTTSLLIAGSAGLGASRLLDEVEQRLAGLDEPFQVVRCSLEASSPGEPYGPIIAGFLPTLSALDDAAFADVIGPVAEPIARLMPALATRLGDSGLLPDRPWIVDPERRQARLLEALLGCLERLGERAPVLLVLEDLQGADFGTRALATFLARIKRPGRLAMIATHRPDEITRDHPLREDLAAMADASDPPSTIRLEPLARDELAALIDGIEGQRPSASELLLVTERSRGNPLVAEEIVAARRELTGVSLAGPFEQIVMARLARRSLGCRRVLRLLALADGAIGADELAIAAGSDRLDRLTLRSRRTTGDPSRGSDASFDYAAALEEAAEHGYLPVERYGPHASHDASGTTVRLRHDLIARAVAADLLPGQRSRDHAALAVALEAHPAAGLSHWLAIHRTDEARAAALRAADQAEAVDAPGDALAALEVALRIGSTAADMNPSDHVDLLQRAAEAAFSVGKTRRAVAYLEFALGRLGPRERARAGRLQERLGLYRRVDGDHEGGLEAQREAVRLIPPSPSVDRAHALASLAQALMLDGAFTEAKVRAQEAIDMAASLGDAGRAMTSHATCTLGICEAYGGDPDHAIELLTAAGALARSMGRMDDLLRAQANLTFAFELQWRLDDAIEIALEAVDEARRVGLDAVYGNQLRGNVASALVLTGRWDEARTLSSRALEWSPAGPPSIEPTMSLAAVEVESRADEVAAGVLGRLLVELEGLPDPQFLVPASRVAASFAIWRGDFDDAKRTVERGWALAKTSEDWIAAARMAGTATEVLVEVGRDARERRDFARLAEVRSAVSEIVSVAEAAVQSSTVDLRAGSRRDAEAWLASARAHRARIDNEDDPRTWDDLARTWRAVGDPYQEARARWRQSEAILATEDARSGRARASRALRGAVEIAGRLGARPLMRELDALASRALISLQIPKERSVQDATPSQIASASSGSPRVVAAFTAGPRPQPGDTFGLSPREREVLKLLAQGRTNREIGDRLFISQKTVGVHVGNILNKLGASGRVEAATVALRLGLVDESR